MSWCNYYPLVIAVVLAVPRGAVAQQREFPDPLADVEVCPICVSKYRAIAEALYENKGIALYRKLFPDAKQDEYRYGSIRRVQMFFERMGQDVSGGQIPHHFRHHSTLRLLKEQGLLEKFSIPPQALPEVLLAPAAVDSTYERLKKKSFDEMTDREYEYFMMKMRQEFDETVTQREPKEKLYERASWALTAYAGLATLVVLILLFGIIT